MRLSRCRASAPPRQVEVSFPGALGRGGVPGGGGVAWHWVPGRGWAGEARGRVWPHVDL